MATRTDPTRPRANQPDLEWAIATGFAYLRPGEWLPLLVQFDSKAALGDTPAARWRWFVREWARSFGDALRVSEVFSDLPLERLEHVALDVCVLYVHKEAAVHIVTSDDWHDHIARAELGPPLIELPLLGGWPGPKPGGPVTRVALGILDQGIAFAHPRFQNASGTRIAAVWRQDVAVIPDAAINAALAKGDSEDTIYRTLGSTDFTKGGYKPLAMRRSHGTQVLDLLAGESKDVDERARPIIAVDMPEHAVGDPAGSLLTPYAAVGLLWTVLVAESIRAPKETLPVVVNLSYGPNEGPHDGSGLLELAIDLLTQLFANSPTPLTVVVAAGNSRQARMHARINARPSATECLRWRLQPGGRTPSALELWFDAGAMPTVTLTAPDGSAVTVNTLKPKDQWPALGTPAMLAELGSWNGRAVVRLTTAPTEADPGLPAVPTVPHGVWTIDVSDAKGSAFGAHAWIRRSETLAGRRAKGRQSYFDEPAYERFTGTGAPQPYDPAPPAVVQRAATLSAAATGRSTFVIGGYVDANVQPARYSSQGPHFNASRARGAPDWLERSDDSLACRGVLAAGNRAGSVAAMNGTSAAAPQAARRIAELIATTGSPLPPTAEFSPVPPHPLWPVPPAQSADLTGKGLRGLGTKRWPPRLRP